MSISLGKTGVNTIGVVMVTAGAGLLWYFVGNVGGVNRDAILNKQQVSFEIPHYTPELERRLRTHIAISRFGVFLTMVGGALQAISNYMPE